MKKQNVPEFVFGEITPDYKAMYEEEVKKHAKLAEDYKQLDQDYMKLDHENDQLRKTIEKYETIIHTVEAFIGQKIIEE